MLELWHNRVNIRREKHPQLERDMTTPPWRQIDGFLSEPPDDCSSYVEVCSVIHDSRQVSLEHLRLSRGGVRNANVAELTEKVVICL